MSEKVERTKPYQGPWLVANGYKLVWSGKTTSRGEYLWALPGGRMMTRRDVCRLCGGIVVENLR
jgi:hypothetical protein